MAYLASVVPLARLYGLEESDDDDELDGFVGQLAPRPRGPHVAVARPEREPAGRGVHRPIVLPDGRAGVCWWERSGGELYDVTVGGRNLVLHRSEFAFAGGPWPGG